MKDNLIKKSKGHLLFRAYPELQMGFSTQDFQKAMPPNMESLLELMDYASSNGFRFIMLRDEMAEMKLSTCKKLATLSEDFGLDLIYEIHKNPLDSGFYEVFKKGIERTQLLPGPKIIRTLVSKSEFDTDPGKKGWTREELDRLVKISEKCALYAKSRGIRFIVENFNEPFFGKKHTYYGFADFFDETNLTGLQFDISNPFRNSSRDKANPDNVYTYLTSFSKRWVTTHIKTAIDGEIQPVLTENPIPIEKIVSLMGKFHVLYVTLELSPVADKQQCFKNHDLSIDFLKGKGILMN